MPGQPEYKTARTWLMANPHANAQEIMAAMGCSWSSAQKWCNKWRRENGMKEPKVPLHPNPRPPMRRVRTPVDELPVMKREEVVGRLIRMHKIIDLYQAKMIKGEGRLKASEVVQLSNAIRSAAQTAQILCDSYPGLSALVDGGAEGQDAVVDDQDTLRQLFGEG